MKVLFKEPKEVGLFGWEVDDELQKQEEQRQTPEQIKEAFLNLVRKKKIRDKTKKNEGISK